MRVRARRVPSRRQQQRLLLPARIARCSQLPAPGANSNRTRRTVLAALTTEREHTQQGMSELGAKMDELLKIVKEQVKATRWL